jgi:hypothetical protein
VAPKSLARGICLGCFPISRESAPQPPKTRAIRTMLTPLATTPRSSSARRVFAAIGRTGHRGRWLAETPAATLEDAAILAAYLGALGGPRHAQAVRRASRPALPSTGHLPGEARTRRDGAVTDGRVWRENRMAVRHGGTRGDWAGRSTQTGGPESRVQISAPRLKASSRAGLQQQSRVERAMPRDQRKGISMRHI